MQQALTNVSHEEADGGTSKGAASGSSTKVALAVSEVGALPKEGCASHEAGSPPLAIAAKQGAKQEACDTVSQTLSQVVVESPQ